jgi:hypothetical protein
MSSSDSLPDDPIDPKPRSVKVAVLENSDDELAADPEADDEIDELEADVSSSSGKGKEKEKEKGREVEQQDVEMFSGTSGESCVGYWPARVTMRFPVLPPPPPPAAPAKRGRGRPRGSKNKVQYGHKVDLVDLVSPSSQKRKRTHSPSDDNTAAQKPTKKRARKPISDEESDLESDVDDEPFNAYIHVVQPPPPPPPGRTIGGKAKLSKVIQEPAQKGPLEFGPKTDFDTFVRKAAKELPCAPGNFPSTDAKWRLELPKTSSFKPLQNQVGYKAMLRELKKNLNKKTTGCTSVFIEIPPPRHMKEVCV